ncbi:MAG: hypothetical protein NC931_00300 [Candidatus Omnitrophica bacterium]|nr:hypothetical protein [Candidatus Omnitrophota bacterium]
MKKIAFLVNLILICGMLCFGQVLQINPWKKDASMLSRFLTVSLSDYLNHEGKWSFQQQKIIVSGIPFQLDNKQGLNNVFLKDAGWKDWNTDPSSYYAAYDSLPVETDISRVMIHIPFDYYSAVYIIGYCENNPDFTDILTLRIGKFSGGHGQTRYFDFSAQVPRETETRRNVARIKTESGAVFLVRIPLDNAIWQDFENQTVLDVDITKEIRLAIRRPDPCRYQTRPLGLPSGIHIYAITFERAPVRMWVGSDQPGHIFNEPSAPVFNVKLSKIFPFKDCEIEAKATDWYGNVTSVSLSDIKVFNTGATMVPLRLDVKKKGYYDLAISVKINKRLVFTRFTSFALLAPDDRKYRNESPFGTWDFCGGHFTSDNPDIVGPLYVKAGLRYGMFGFSDEARKKYGIIKGNDMKLSDRQIEELAEKIKKDPSIKVPERLMIFHENAISGEHIMRVPDVFTGRKYVLSESEEKKFKEMWDYAEKTATAIRKHFPKTEIYFGNGAPQLLEEFCRNKFPAELLGSRGNEAGNFMRMPETQPPDFIANNAGLWMDRMILDYYGYKNTPLRQCYEMCYPNTNPGNLSPETQAKYFVRHMMHSLAWRIPIIRAGIITDVGNSYYFSNWGAAGLCYGIPDIRPKPAYVAIAAMTRVLDGAKFSRAIPVNSSVVYGLEFMRKDGKYVSSLWTIRGTRDIEIIYTNRVKGFLTDMMGNETFLTVKNNSVSLTISSEPVYITADRPALKIVAGAAKMEERPKKDFYLISSLGNLSEWKIEQGINRELETYNFNCPRRKGNFEFKIVDYFEGETNVMQIKPKLPVPGSEYLPMYEVLAHNTGVEIPGVPTKIGLMVNGNGGWGRIIFELEDASGQRWISIGAEQKGEPTRWMADWFKPEEFAQLKSSNLCDWNTDDAWQRSYINFEGWRYLEFPLPGNYPGEGYHWPYSSQWRYFGDGVVKYPLKFKKLIITLPERVLYLTDYKRVLRQEIYIKDLMVTYQVPEFAFKAE